MNPAEKQSKAARLIVDLFQRRRDMQRLLGPHYVERVRPFRQILRDKARGESRPIVEVALEICKKLDVRGHNPNLMFCALIDECESAEARL